MTNDIRSPADIERDIERDREALSENIQGIQEKLSFDTIVQQIGEQFREHGADISRALGKSVKENPMAVALTGVGLAWMIFGRGPNNFGPDRSSSFDDRSFGGRNSHRRMRGDSARRYVDESAWNADREIAKRPSDDVPLWARDREHAARQYGDEPLWSRDRDDSDSSSSNTAAESTIGNSVTQALAEGVHALADGAHGLSARLTHGTENLSEAARDRVVAARQQAMDAKRKVVRKAHRAAEKASDFFEEQPLALGAIAFAVGAAVGSALPRTQMEDDALGDHSDALFAEAERLFHAEQANAERILGAAAKEVKTIVEEVKDSAERAMSDSSTSGEADAGGAHGADNPKHDAMQSPAQTSNH